MARARKGGGALVKIIFFVDICAIPSIYKSIETYKGDRGNLGYPGQSGPSRKIN